MTELDRVRTQLNYSKKQTAYAWANHYKHVENQLVDAIDNHKRLVKVEKEESIPNHIKEEMKEMANLLKKKWECPICLNMIENGKLEITGCGHFYCRDCLKQHQQTSKANNEPKWKCATCRRKQSYKEFLPEPVPVPAKKRRPRVAVE